MSNELTLDDARLAARVAATLTKAASEADAAWEARVADIAAGRIKPPSRSHRLQWSGGLALAASVTFMLAMPGSWLIKASSSSQPVATAGVEGQMLEEIDWLMAMEEAASEGR